MRGVTGAVEDDGRDPDERGYESNGAMWFSVVELMVWSLLIAQSFTSCVLFSKAAWTPGIILYITVPYYLYRYICSIKAEFGSGSAWSVPLGGGLV